MKKELLFQFPLETDCCLKDALETLDVADLQGMLFLIHLNGGATEDKTALIQAIMEVLPDAIHRFALCFDTERYQLFQTILAQGGVVDADKFSVRKILALRDMGLAYPTLQGERRVLVVPREIRDMLATLEEETWKEVAECNTRILRRAGGLLCYYGFLETKMLIQLCLQKEPDGDWDIMYFMELLYAAILYYGNIEPEEDGFRHKRFWNYAYVRKQQKRLKQIPDYKVFSGSVLERVGKTNGIEWTLPMERLKQFLVKEGHLTKSVAKREVESAWYELNNGIPFAEVCEHFTTWYFALSTAERQEALGFYLLQVFCTMPLWLLNGYSFAELGEIEEIEELQC